MFFYHHIFTATEKGREQITGFQVAAESPGLPLTTSRELTAHVRHYARPRVTDSGAGPKAYAFTRLTDGWAAVTLTKDKGPFLGRDGNFAAHSFVFREAELASTGFNVFPVLLGAELERDLEDIGLEPPPLDPPRFEDFDDARIEQGFEALERLTGQRDAFKNLLVAALGKAGRRILLACESHELLNLFEALMALSPPKCRPNLTFGTYVANPQDTPYMLAGNSFWDAQAFAAMAAQGWCVFARNQVPAVDETGAGSEALAYAERILRSKSVGGGLKYSKLTAAAVQTDSLTKEVIPAFVSRLDAIDAAVLSDSNALLMHRQAAMREAPDRWAWEAAMAFYDLADEKGVPLKLARRALKNRNFASLSTLASGDPSFRQALSDALDELDIDSIAALLEKAPSTLRLRLYQLLRPPQNAAWNQVIPALREAIDEVGSQTAPVVQLLEDCKPLLKRVFAESELETVATFLALIPGLGKQHRDAAEWLFKVMVEIYAKRVDQQESFSKFCAQTLPFLATSPDQLEPLISYCTRECGEEFATALCVAFGEAWGSDPKPAILASIQAAVVKLLADSDFFRTGLRAVMNGWMRAGNHELVLQWAITGATESGGMQLPSLHRRVGEALQAAPDSAQELAERLAEVNERNPQQLWEAWEAFLDNKKAKSASVLVPLLFANLHACKRELRRKTIDHWSKSGPYSATESWWSYLSGGAAIGSYSKVPDVSADAFTEASMFLEPNLVAVRLREWIQNRSDFPRPGDAPVWTLGANNALLLAAAIVSGVFARQGTHGVMKALIVATHELKVKSKRDDLPETLFYALSATSGEAGGQRLLTEALKEADRTTKNAITNVVKERKQTTVQTLIDCIGTAKSQLDANKNLDGTAKGLVIAQLDRIKEDLMRYKAVLQPEEERRNVTSVPIVTPPIPSGGSEEMTSAEMKQMLDWFSTEVSALKGNSTTKVLGMERGGQMLVLLLVAFALVIASLVNVFYLFKVSATLTELSYKMEETRAEVLKSQAAARPPAPAPAANSAAETPPPPANANMTAGGAADRLAAQDDRRTDEQIVRSCVAAMFDRASDHMVVVTPIQTTKLKDAKIETWELPVFWADFYLAYKDPSNNKVDLFLSPEMIEGKNGEPYESIAALLPNSKVSRNKVIPAFAKIPCPATRK